MFIVQLNYVNVLAYMKINANICLYYITCRIGTTLCVLSSEMIDVSRLIAEEFEKCRLYLHFLCRSHVHWVGVNFRWYALFILYSPTVIVAITFRSVYTSYADIV